MPLKYKNYGKNTLWVSSGVDLQGDACIYIQVLGANGEHKRFLETHELGEFVDLFQDHLGETVNRA